MLGPTGPARRLEEFKAMDQQTLHDLARVIRTPRIGSLGTLHDEEPLVSMVAIAPEPDFQGFLFLASTLAQHTQDFLADPRVSLMLADPDAGGPSSDPLALGRVSLRGRIERVAPDDHAAVALYLARFPRSRMLFGLGDFALYRLVPRVARFVAGFGRTYNLVPEHLAQAAALAPHSSTRTD